MKIKKKREEKSGSASPSENMNQLILFLFFSLSLFSSLASDFSSLISQRSNVSFSFLRLLSVVENKHLADVYPWCHLHISNKEGTFLNY